MSDFLTDDEMAKLESEQAPAAQADISPDFLSDDEMSVMESGPSELSPSELAKTGAGTVIGGAIGAGSGKAVKAGTEKILDPFAEDLAYRGAGGYSGTKAGRELNASMIETRAGNIKKGISELAEGGAFDNGVTNRSVGREILDKNLLGPGGLGFKADNAVRAKTNLMKTSEPTNALLNSIEEYPVHQDSIFKKMKEILGYDELNETVPEQSQIKSKVDKLNDKSFGDIETPMQAERAKRDLQRGADFADPERTVKNAMNTAQSTARKEAVEDAVLQALGPEKLEEFKRLKASSGSAGIASDMLSELYDKSQKPFSGFNSITGTAIDFIKQRGSGIGANALDKVSKVAKSAAPGVGTAIGALVGGLTGAAAADEQTDSADFIPVLDQATAAGSALDDKMIQTEVKARQNYDKSPAASDRAGYLRQTIQDTPESFRNGFAYKQAQDELAKLEGSYKASDNLTSNSEALKRSSPEQLMELSNSFKNVKGADNFVAPLEQAAQSSSDEERQARLFGLYQQPAFRQLLKKNQN